MQRKSLEDFLKTAKNQLIQKKSLDKIQGGETGLGGDPRPLKPAGG